MVYRGGIAEKILYAIRSNLFIEIFIFLETLYSSIVSLLNNFGNNLTDNLVGEFFRKRSQLRLQPNYSARIRVYSNISFALLFFFFF